MYISSILSDFNRKNTMFYRSKHVKMAAPYKKIRFLPLYSHKTFIWNYILYLQYSIILTFRNDIPTVLYSIYARNMVKINDKSIYILHVCCPRVKRPANIFDAPPLTHNWIHTHNKNVT